MCLRLWMRAHWSDEVVAAIERRLQGLTRERIDARLFMRCGSGNGSPQFALRSASASAHRSVESSR